MENENNCQFLIEKREAGKPLNELDELLACEEFFDEQAEEVDEIMKQLDFLDDTAASSIGDLLLAVTNAPEIAKYCDCGHWESLTGTELIEVPCLVKKHELNKVEEFIQKFATKSEMESAELEVISNSLETISDLDDASLQAVYNLLKIEFSEATITKRWPSMFKSTDSQSEQSTVKKIGLKWPSLQSHL